MRCVRPPRFCAGTNRRVCASELHVEVLVVGDVLEPVDGATVDTVLDGDVGHGGGVGGAVPVFDAGRRPDHVTGFDRQLLTAPLLHPSGAYGHDERLAG